MPAVSPRSVRNAFRACLRPFTYPPIIVAVVATTLSAATAASAQTYTLSTLANFTGTSNGANPFAGVTLDSSGNLYGTTTIGGANGKGTAYKIASGINTLTTLATFTGTGNGANPYAGLTLDSSGNLYGTTANGGSSDQGTVFKIAAGTNTLTTLATFTGAVNGSNPYGGLTLDGNGNLYGTTNTSGSGGAGTVFKITLSNNALTTVAAFTGTANGANPESGLVIDGSGNLYGTTQYGGTNNLGTVFKIAAGTNTLTTLATFNGAGNGSLPFAGLTLDSSGNLYGTTEYGGGLNAGTVFKVAAGTNTLTTLATFTGAGNGANPLGGLTFDTSGNLYGTTRNGGASGNGTAFKIFGVGTTNMLTTIATFNGTNGQYPDASLTIDSSGNLFGTTIYGGSSNNGSVFKLTVSGAATPEPGALALLMPALPLAAARIRKHSRFVC